MRIFLTSLFIVFAVLNALSQQSYDKLPKVFSSTIVEDTQTYRRDNPKVQPAEIAAFANQKLGEKGFDFIVDPCDMKSKPTTIKFPDEDDREVFHVYHATNLAGKRQSFLARQPNDAPCGCWLSLPVKTISERRMTIVTNGNMLVVRPPKDFLFEETTLVDATLRKSTRTWITPNGGGPPDGISTDGTKLYVKIEDTPLFLEIPSNGSLRFVPRNSPGIIKKFVDLKKFPRDRFNDYLGFRRFTSGKKIYTVKFSHVCT